jgi:hypothetical protein
MPEIYYNDPDLIWIQDAVEEYGRARGTIARLVDQGILHKVEFFGDKRDYLRRSELDRVLGQPIKDAQPNDKSAG